MRERATLVLTLALMLALVTCSPATRASNSPTPPSTNTSEAGPADATQAGTSAIEPSATGTWIGETPSAPVEALQPTQGTTYYVRPDGGAYPQCNGQTDAPYTGGSPDCAWNHPFQALPPDGSPRIAGGDTLFIASSSYMLGYAAPGADNCYPDEAYECHMPPIPSGPDAAHPTRVLGQGWDAGCSNPPELWGSQRPWYLINLTGSDNVEIVCLEITDHSSCVESHADPSLACQRDTYPFGDWAPVGIHAEDASNVSLRDLDIHGLASTGIHAGRLADWTLEDVRIAGNGWVGWDGDLWDGDDANSGTLTFRRWTVEWNGCGETYPGNQPTGCWGQTAGGYGDGVGTGATGGDWIIEDSQFLHNTSDGLDLLYHTLGGQVVLRRVRAEGNAGDQIKTAGPTTAENVIAVSNCGFFEGQPFTYDVDNCRAGGSAMAFTFIQAGEQINVVNSTLTGQGDCLIITEGPDGSVLLRNNIFLGNPEFGGGGDTTCLTWYGTSSDPFDLDYALIDGVKAYPEPCPSNSLCAVSPGLVNDSIDNFDAHLLETSPAIDVGDYSVCPPTDYDGNPRPVGGECDLGAYEFASEGQNQAPYQPSSPDPAHGEIDVPLDQMLSWQGGDPDGDPVTYTVALGTRDPPPFASTTVSNHYTPDLITNTTYYWAITATDGLSVTPGPTWYFVTVALSPTETRNDGAIRLTTLPAGASDQNPAFSPDGSRLVFTRFQNGYNIGPARLFLLDSNDSQTTPLTPEEDRDNVNLPGSVWNEVTDRIVFASDRLEADDLWRIAPDGTDFNRITTHSSPPFYLEPSWSPDGQWVVFEAADDLSDDQRQGSIWKVRADGSELMPLTDGPGGGTDDRQPNWSPTGDRVLFQRRTAGSDDWNLSALWQISAPALSSIYLPIVSKGGGTLTPPLSLASVNDFVYQLQGLDLSAIGETAYDLVIMDYSAEGDDETAFSAVQIEALKHSPGGDKIVLAYMSIGEAENYRFYWDESWDADGDGQPDPGAPTWLDVENPDWEGNYKVHYWDPGWQSIVFSYTNRLLDVGFDGAYLDIIDAYEYYEDQGRTTAAQEMVDLLSAIRAHAQTQDAGFYIFPQNAPQLAQEVPDYLSRVDGIGQEDIYYGYDEDDVMTPPTVTLEMEGYLNLFLGDDKLVLTVDYATTPGHVHDAYTKSQAKGFVPFATVRELDQLTIHPGHEPD